MSQQIPPVLPHLPKTFLSIVTEKAWEILQFTFNLFSYFFFLIFY